MSSLHNAVENGNLEMVELLLKNNAPVNQTNGFGQSSLHVCCNSNKPNEEILARLIYSEADINLQDMNGHTPLHYIITIHARLEL